MNKDKLKAIIIDDSHYTRELIKKALEDKGVKIVGEASDGMEGLLLYKKFKPDIVTLEGKAQKSNGLDVVRSVLSFDKHANIIMITSLLDMEEVSLKLGVKSFLKKPFQPAFLWRRIDKMEKDGCFNKSSAETISSNNTESKIDDTVVNEPPKTKSPILDEGRAFIDDSNVYEENLLLLIDEDNFVEIEKHEPNKVILEIEKSADPDPKPKEVRAKEGVLERENTPADKTHLDENNEVQEGIIRDTDGIISIRPPRGNDKTSYIKEDIQNEKPKIKELTLLNSKGKSGTNNIKSKDNIFNKIKSKFKF